MKKILGLDIGTTSIGWAIVEASEEKPMLEKKYFNYDMPETKTDTNNQRTGIHFGKDGLPAVGVRIIPQGDIGQRFDSGKKLNEGKKHTPTAERRIYRSARKTKSRYKLRRDKLCSVLHILEMLPGGSYEQLSINGKKIWRPIERINSKWYTKAREYEQDELGIRKKKRRKDIGEQLYELRAQATINRIELKDWGRILLHLNQWRGYSSDRFKSSEKEETSAGITAIVDKIGKGEDYIVTKKQRGKEFETAYNTFIISFDNGDKAIEVRSKENDESYFKIGGLYTYSFKDEDEINGYKKITEKKKDKESWAYRKKEINDTIEAFIKEKQEKAVGSYFYQKHYIEKSLSRIRANTINREWYEDEFEKIWKAQFDKHKENFTENKINQCIDAAFIKDEAVKKQLKKIENPEERLKTLIRDNIIYYQRSWQQSKNKGECRFEKIPDTKKDKNGKIIPHPEGKKRWKGRTVIPRSHPLHQEYKIWQQINNVRIWFHQLNEKEVELMENEIICKEKLGKTPNEIKELLYERLQQKKEQSWRTFVNDLFPHITIKLKKSDEKKKFTDEHFSVNYIKLSKKKEEQDNLLKGNKTKVQLKEILSEKSDDWYSQIIKTGSDNHNQSKTNKDGRLISSLSYQTKEYAIPNLQFLWEIIYDITGFQAGNDRANSEMIKKKIRNHFTEQVITNDQCEALAGIKFDDSGMGNLSARAIRKLLPLMVCGKYSAQYPFPQKVRAQVDTLIHLNQQESYETNDELKLYSIKEFIPDKKARIKLSKKMSENDFRGLNYWEAAAVAYGNHSNAGITDIPANEINQRMNNLQTVKHGSMNNPVVEKIVNETLKLVQLIYQTYVFDEVRIELSRELKANREEREAMWEAMSNNKERNELAKKMLREMFTGEDISDKDLSPNSNNIDKIKIIEDVVANLKGKDHNEKKKEFKINEPTKADIKRYRHWLEQEFKCPYTDQPIPFSDVFSKIKKVEIEHIIPRERYRDNSYSNKVITWLEVNTAKAENGNRTAYEFIVRKRDREKVNVAGKELNLVSDQQWEEHVNKMFKGRKAKNLLRTGIPEDPINRELKETQYITKKLREKLGEALGFDKVWTTTGQITDMLRNTWHLNDKVMQELLRERYEKFKPPMGQGTTMESIPECNLIYDNEIVDKNTGEVKTRKEFPNFSKRLDHRHHALDAIIVACTTQLHIQSINNLNAKFEVKHYNGDNEEKQAQKIKYKTIDGIILRMNEDGKPTFKEPWDADKFVPEVKESLCKIIVSHKNSNVLISPSKNKQIDPYNYTSVSIRQRLHAETLVGKRKIYNRLQTSIDEIIHMIFEERKRSEKAFLEIITAIVFKEKYQKQLISLFERFQNLETDEERKIKIIEEIQLNKSAYFSSATTFIIQPVKRGSESVAKINYNNVIDERTQRHIKYRQDFNEEIEKKFKGIKDSPEKKAVNNFTDHPIYYNALYDVRFNDGTWKPLFEFDKSMLSRIQYIKYKNGEKKEDNFRTELVKKVLSEYSFPFDKENTLLKNPVFIPNKKHKIDKIVIRKATVLNRFGKNDKSNYSEENKKEVLIEIRPKTFVSTEGKFRALVTESSDEIKKKHFQFIDHLTALKYQKLENDYIKAEIKIPSNLIGEGYKFLFTLTKNDFVIIPNSMDTKIDWNNIPEVSRMLYRVVDFDETGYIRFAKHTIADMIQLNDKYDALGLEITIKELREKLEKEKELHSTEEARINLEKESHFTWKKSLKKEDLKFENEAIKRKESEIKTDQKNLNLHKKEISGREKEIGKLEKAIEFASKDDKPASPIEENVIVKSYDEMQKIIKVFINTLGKKVVPYWEFQCGCWNKERAREMGLIPKI